MADSVPDHWGDGAAGGAGPSDPAGFFAGGVTSELMARLTLSVLERAKGDPSLWREPVVHRAVLVSGLSVLVGSLVRLRADLQSQEPLG
jgi:hypothetical protein